MNGRKLHLAAYDVADPERLQRALRVLRDYATGGQKSVFECYLTPGEKQALIQRVQAVLDLQEDRFFILELNPRRKTRTLGVAVRPQDPAWFYFG